MQKTTIIISGILLILLSQCSTSTDPQKLTKNYFDTYNTRNVDEILSMYATNAKFELVGKYTIEGMDALRGFTEFDSVLHIQITYSDLKSDGNTVSVNITETNDWLKMSGIGNAYYACELTFDEGLVSYLKVKMALKTQQDYDKIFPGLMQWASQNKKDVLDRIMLNGTFVRNAKTATINLDLLKEWLKNKEE